MKKLMYLSIAILCLSISALIGFHIGSQAVQAQAPEPISGYRVVLDSGNGDRYFVMLSNGDVYYRHGPYSDHSWDADPPEYFGNFWQGRGVPTNQTNWDQIKGEYKAK